MNNFIVIDNMLESDWQQVRDIYIEGINTGNATFETKAPSWEEWDTGHHQECRLVVREGNNVIGWAALSPVSKREAYRGVAEVSIYLSLGSAGKGVGTKLLSRIIELSEMEEFWTLQAGIFPENETSIKLHQKLGFEIVGIRKQIGKLNGEWRDVVLLERRSKVVGLD